MKNFPSSFGGIDYSKVDGSGKTAQELCREIAESAYKEVPELEKVMPKKNSKILSVPVPRLNRDTREPKEEIMNLNTGMTLTILFYVIY